MSHVNDEVGTDKVGNLAHAGVVNEPAVCGSTSHDSLGAVEDCGLLEHVIVDDAGFKVNSVGHGLKVGGNSRDSTIHRGQLGDILGILKLRFDILL